MSKYEGLTLMNGKPFDLDGAEFSGCTIIDSPLSYSGGELPVLIGTRFEKCQIRYSGDPDKRQQFVDFLNGSGSFVDCNMS